MRSLIHLAMMGAAALWVARYLPGSGWSPLFAVIMAVIAESLPRRFRFALVPELLLAAWLAVCWWLVVPQHDRMALRGLIVLGMVMWILIPSQSGMLRWLLIPITAGALIRPPWGFGWWPSATLWVLGIMALAADAWISAHQTMRIGPVRRTWSTTLSWLMGPVFVVTAIALMIGPTVVTQAETLRSGLVGNRVHGANQRMELGAGSVTVGLSRYLEIGGVGPVNTDLSIAARLNDDAVDAMPGMVYLRALSLTELTMDGGQLRWDPASTLALMPWKSPPVPSAHRAWLYRAPGCGDVVLRPDEGGRVELAGMVQDADHNVYCAGLGEAPRLYRVSLWDDEIPETDPARFRVMPTELKTFPWDRLVDPEWRNWKPERAAQAIMVQLQQRCRYEVEHLPVPSPEPGAALRVFLFGNDQERRGHCQYFATAAVLMLRQAGHAARCVAGFASDERDERGVIFRACHAHAWIEIVASDGRWHRFDPTPAIVRAQVMAEQLAEDHQAGGASRRAAIEELKPVPFIPGERERQARMQLITGVVLVGLIAAIWWVLRRRRRQQQKALDRHADELAQLAIECGIPVRRSATLSSICAALSARTGIDLRVHLAAHLAARYGTGVAPPPWPVAELRAALVTES